MRGFVVFCSVACFAFDMVYGNPGDSSGAGEKRFTRQDYITTYKDAAVKDMLKTGIPASITLAQGMLESDNGNSRLAVEANNHFGIKCHSDWTGKTFYQDDDKKNECFRKYKSVEESFDDHSSFLRTRSRYEFLFKLDPADYKGWAHGLKKAGYATNPEYDKLLIRIIEENKLYEFDGKGTRPSFAASPEKKSHTSRSSNGLVVASEVSLSRQVHSNNQVKYIVVKKGDTFEKIALELDMEVWQLTRYNDISRKDELTEGNVLYIKPKRRQAKEEFHAVKAGETLHSISQQYAVKVKHLLRYNKTLREGEPLKEGTKILLRRPGR